MIPVFSIERYENGSFKAIKTDFMFISNDPAHIAQFFFWLGTVF